MNWFYERYVAGESLLAISSSIQLSPCLFARLMLSHFLKLHPHLLALVRQPIAATGESKDEGAGSDEEDAATGPPAAGGDTPQRAPRRTNTNPRGGAGSPSKTDLKRLMKDPSLIPDDRMGKEVLACIGADDTYSPLAERIRQYLHVLLLFLPLPCSSIYT